MDDSAGRRRGRVSAAAIRSWAAEAATPCEKLLWNWSRDSEKSDRKTTERPGFPPGLGDHNLVWRFLSRQMARTEWDERAIGSWLDFGMFLQNMIVEGPAHRLDTSVQTAFAPCHRIVRALLPIEGAEVVVCGMSLGYADPDAPENRLTGKRSSSFEFATFIRWESGGGRTP